MRQLYGCGLLGLAAGLGLLLPGTVHPQGKGGESVGLKVVKYDGLAEEIMKHRGKVILVDFWADY